MSLQKGNIFIRKTKQATTNDETEQVSHLDPIKDWMFV